MAIRFYDEALYEKIKAWDSDNRLTILKPQDVVDLFEQIADQKYDKPLQLPLVTLSREPTVSILSTNKKPLTFDGKRINHTTVEFEPGMTEEQKLDKIYDTPNLKAASLNAIPIQLNYQLDIFTRRYDEGDEYLRNFIFQLINYPKLKIEVPYNKNKVEHVCTIRILPNVEDTSQIPQKLFKDQFTRWTIKLEIDDAYLWSIPIQPVWKVVETQVVSRTTNREEEIIS